MNPRLFGAIAAFRAERDLRYYLSCVHVRPHPHMPGALIACTDGHQLALAYDESAKVERTMLLKVTPRTVSACLARPAHALELRDGRLCVDRKRHGYEPEEAHVQAGQAVAPDDWIRSFPIYDSLMPDGPDDLQPYSMGPAAPRLVERLAQTARRLGEGAGNRWGGMVNHSRRNHGEPAINPYSASIFTTFDVAPHVIVLTMPMRIEAPPFPLFVTGLAAEGRRRVKARDAGRILSQKLMARAELEINRDAEPVAGMEA